MVFETIVIGGGIAGLSAAAQLDDASRVAVLEQERFPGYHTTGRSAALFAETYGNDLARALTTLSRPFFLEPPTGFATHQLLHQRGLLTFGREDQLTKLKDYFERAQVGILKPRWLEAREARELVPAFRAEYVAGAVLEQQASDIDVHELLSGFLRLFREKGGKFVGDARVVEISPNARGWDLRCEDGRVFSCKMIANAAGAWADEIAKLAGLAPLGLTPLRRSAVLIDPPLGLNVASWPFCEELEERFYFRPDAGSIMISLANETPSAPCDCQPEEIEIAEAIDRFASAVDLEVRRVKRSWAGLRTFAPDRRPVAGFDQKTPAFFWLVGQGGVGVQTSPALGKIAASLIEKGKLSGQVLDHGVKAESLSPARFQQSSPATA